MLDRGQPDSDLLGLAASKDKQVADLIDQLNSEMATA
jgi:hypothetical protein